MNTPEERREQARAIREQQRSEDQYEFRKLLICPDFSNIWAEIDDDDSGELGLSIGDGLDWGGEAPIPYDLIVRFDDWQSTFEHAPFDSDMFLVLDWDAFHQEGMALAIEIKRVLGDGIGVSYVKAFEDRNRGKKTRFDVSSDGQLLCVDLPEITE